MSFRKQLSIFVTVLIVLPMGFFFHISTLVLDEQITHSEQTYLQNALLLARNNMLSRKREMQQGGQHLAVHSGFRQSLRHQDRVQLEEHIATLRGVYPYLDFLNITSHFDINGLVRTAEQTQQAIFSEEAFDLSLLFHPQSAPFQQFRVKITHADGPEQQVQYLTKCQAGVVVVPLFEQGALLGYTVLGGISNNDPYFPETYSRQVKHSFLAISVDGIRVTSNIRTPKKTDYIGSRMPVQMDGMEGEKLFYFGRVNIDGEVHVFIDEPIVDSTGKTIGALGVGIPEESFSRILSTNRNLILLVTVFSLVLMLFIAKHVSKYITKPILLAINSANGGRTGRQRGETQGVCCAFAGRTPAPAGIGSRAAGNESGSGRQSDRPDA